MTLLIVIPTDCDDDSVGWTGSAGEQATYKVKYKQDWKLTDSADSPNEVGDILYIQTRNAEYEAQLVQSNTLNPVTGVLSTTYTRSGDPHGLGSLGSDPVYCS